MLLDMSESDMNELSVGESKAQRSALFRAIHRTERRRLLHVPSHLFPSRLLLLPPPPSLKQVFSLSASELGSWLESKDGDFGKEFARSDIDGDRAADLCMDDSKGPSLCQASDWKSKWKSLISTIKIASSRM